MAADMAKTPAQHSPKSQIDKFRQLAHKLETDNDEARFDERLKKLAVPRATKDAKKR